MGRDKEAKKAKKAKKENSGKNPTYPAPSPDVEKVGRDYLVYIGRHKQNPEIEIWARFMLRGGKKQKKNGEELDNSNIAIICSKKGKKLLKPENDGIDQASHMLMLIIWRVELQQEINTRASKTYGDIYVTVQNWIDQKRVDAGAQRMIITKSVPKSEARVHDDDDDDEDTAMGNELATPTFSNGNRNESATIENDEEDFDMSDVTHYMDEPPPGSAGFLRRQKLGQKNPAPAAIAQQPKRESTPYLDNFQHVGPDYHPEGIISQWELQNIDVRQHTVAEAVQKAFKAHYRKEPSIMEIQWSWAIARRTNAKNPSLGQPVISSAQESWKKAWKTFPVVPAPEKGTVDPLTVFNGLITAPQLNNDTMTSEAALEADLHAEFDHVHADMALDLAPQEDSHSGQEMSVPDTSFNRYQEFWTSTRGMGRFMV